VVALPPKPFWHVYAAGICYLSVCTSIADRAEIERRANADYPTGIGRAWTIHEGPFKGGQPNPCPCNEHSDRKHWLLSC